jgi:hypothetical protein
MQCGIGQNWSARSGKLTPISAQGSIFSALICDFFSRARVITAYDAMNRKPISPVSRYSPTVTCNRGFRKQSVCSIADGSEVLRSAQSVTNR